MYTSFASSSERSWSSCFKRLHSCESVSPITKLTVKTPAINCWRTKQVWRSRSHRSLFLIGFKHNPNQSYIIQKYRYLRIYISKYLFSSTSLILQTLIDTKYIVFLCKSVKDVLCVWGHFKKYHLQCTKAHEKIFNSSNDRSSCRKMFLKKLRHKCISTRRAGWKLRVSEAFKVSTPSQ